jgi:hypothetical protein
MIHRGTFAGRRSPGPFHCLSCQTYVTGTESGHCPRCGFVPPSAPQLPPSPRSGSSVVLVVVLALVLGLLVIAYQ